jgi:hypothetical protein
MEDWWSQLFDFSDYGALIVLLQNSLWAGAILGLVGGLVGVFVMSRDLAFAVHGISELSFAGAAAGLLLGVGSLVGSVLYRRRAARHRERVDIYADDGSMVSITNGRPPASEAAVASETAPSSGAAIRTASGSDCATAEAMASPSGPSSSGVVPKRNLSR